MNWQRGLTRAYLVLWFLWAVTLVGVGIFGYLRYDQPTKRALVQVPGSETTYPHEDSDSTVSSYYDWREVPTGPARLHFEGLESNTVMSVLALAFVLPATLLVAVRWIVAGFRRREGTE